MAFKVVIFSDANKIFGMYRAVVAWSDLADSSFLLTIQNTDIEIVISEFVLLELEIICKRNWISWNETFLQRFFECTQFTIFSSKKHNTMYESYVQDIGDAQILQDAVDSWSIFLLTGNMKDFHIKKIYDMFGILVINDLHQAIVA